LPVDAYDAEYGTVTLSSDGATVFATAYNSFGSGDSYFVGTSTNGSIDAVVYITLSSFEFYSSPVVVNSTTVAWTPEFGGLNGKFLFTLENVFCIFTYCFVFYNSLVLTDVDTNTLAVVYNFSSSGDSGLNPEAIAFRPSSNDGFTIYLYNLGHSSYQTLYNFTSNVDATAIVYANNALYVTLESGESDMVL